MRGVLVDWLVEVEEEYKLLSDTYYYTAEEVPRLFHKQVQLIRFLSVNVIPRQRLQLLGVSSMLIDVMRKLSLHMLRIFITLQPIHIQRKMEASVLQSLKFEMGNLTTKTFLRRFTMVAQEDYNNPDLQLEFLCYYLAELSLPDHHCEILAFFGSCCCEISVKVHFTAKVLESGPSTRSGYRAADLKDCVLIIHDFQLNRRGSTLAAVRNKYKQHKFKCMSTLSSPLEILDCFFEDTC